MRKAPVVGEPAATSQAAVVARAQGRFQRRRLLGRRQELDLHDQLHLDTRTIWSMSPRWTPDPDVRRGRSVVYNLHAHLVFTTKYRRGALTDAILTRCQQIMADVCAGFGAELREFNGEHDHVHLLVHYPPTVALSKLVNSLKGVSARYLRQEFGPHLRRSICGAGTCGRRRTSPHRAAEPRSR